MQQDKNGGGVIRLSNELDCDREASRNLNRLLDGPGGSERGAMQIYL